MAITGSQLVQDAMFACGALGVGDNLDNADAQLVLRRLNRLIGSWANDPPMSYTLEHETFNMTTGQSDYSTSVLVSGIRPIAIDSVYVRLNAIDYEVQIVDNQTYQGVRYKSAVGTPNIMYANSGMPNWDLHFYPTPYTNFECHLIVGRLIWPSDVTLSMTITLPPGYEKLLVDSLAVDIGPAFGRPPDPLMMQQAQSAIRRIKRSNYSPLVMQTIMSDPPRSVYADFFSL